MVDHVQLKVATDSFTSVQPLHSSIYCRMTITNIHVVVVEARVRLILETRVRLMRLIWSCQCQEPREKHAAHLLCLVSLLPSRPLTALLAFCGTDLSTSPRPESAVQCRLARPIRAIRFFHRPLQIAILPIPRSTSPSLSITSDISSTTPSILAILRPHTSTLQCG